MSLKKLTAFALAGLMTVGAVATVSAEDANPAEDPRIAGKSMEELVAIRIELMKEDGVTLRQAMKQTGAEAKASAEHLLHNYTILPHAYPEGSKVGDTNAKDTIWSDWEGFNAIFVKGQNLAKDMIAAADAGDADAFNTAARALSGTCNECHDVYRDPL